MADLASGQRDSRTIGSRALDLHGENRVPVTDFEVEWLSKLLDFPPFLFVVNAGEGDGVTLDYLDLFGIGSAAPSPSAWPTLSRMADALEEWSEPERIADYLSREIPHRAIAEEVLIEALPEKVERFLDLGTGDGRLLAAIRGRHPGARAVGLDASGPMLGRAAERFDGDPLVELRPHDLGLPLGDAGPADAVVSGLAIHHLPDGRKRELFEEIHALLTPSGVFANLDLVSAASLRLHERFRREIGRTEDDPSDRLADLAEQVGWLREVGFGEVDCHFKWLELALVVAVKDDG
jgi:SAM-dependent methyltransferase